MIYIYDYIYIYINIYIYIYMQDKFIFYIYYIIYIRYIWNVIFNVGFPIKLLQDFFSIKRTSFI